MNTANSLFALKEYENIISQIKGKKPAKEKKEKEKEKKVSDSGKNDSGETTMKEILTQMEEDEKKTPDEKKRTNKVRIKK